MSETGKKTKKSIISADLLSMLTDIAKSWRIIIIVSLIAAMLGYTIGAETYEPRYRTSVTFVISATGDSASVFSSLTTASNFADVFKLVLDSDMLKKRVVEKMGGEPEGLSMSTELVTSTNILILSVYADNPLDSYNTTCAILECYPEFTDSFMSNAYLDVLSPPKVAYNPSNSFPAMNYAKRAFVYTALLLIIAIGFVSYMTDKIKNENEASKKLDMKQLGMIYHEKSSKLARKNGSILITTPTTGYFFVENIKMIRTRIEYYMKKLDRRVLAVTSVQAGEGKSTFSANIAIALAQKGYKVLLIDGDLIKPSLFGVFSGEMTEGCEMFDYIRQKDRDTDDMIRFAGLPNLYLMLNSSRVKNSTEQMITLFLSRFIDSAAQEFDYIIIDTPPITVSPDAETITSLSDASLLVVRQNYALTSAINDAADQLRENSNLLGFVLNNIRMLSLSMSGGYGYVYGYGKYGYGKYGYGKYGYGKYGRKNSSEETKPDGEDAPDK